MPLSTEPHTSSPADPRVLPRVGFDSLLAALQARGYRLIGPTIRDRAIVYDTLESSADLPVGWTDEQEGGTYRLARRDDEALFGYAVGVQSWKRYLWPPDVRLWRVKREGDSGFAVIPEEDEPPRDAYIGVRSCELHAIAHLDDALLHVPEPDAMYAARRERVFVVALNCHQAGGTCFCVSMDTGPRATFGYDVALTEVIEDGEHWFLVQAGSDAGAEVLAELSTGPAGEREMAAADRAVERAASNQGRTMDTTDIKDLLYRNYEHPRWEDVADRCLTCGNCTMVCPTCFCTTVEDVTDLEGDIAERHRQWDSCFTMDFSYVHGGSVRPSGKSRYRQWMTHKLATWIDQFGTSGCVGCGRCITWCPVAIDITEEVAAIRADDRGGPDQLPTERPPR
ncbi:MAG TPA: 4Fe-4S dicluster domain-containing protein [Solirubrobacterales bacterium]|nr:4Fe-4S dicluster domain-containing protein [Solirubrobacterales bacterium]